MAKENKARYAILGLLSTKPASGYDIKKMTQSSTSHFWGENDSSIYPTLKNLYVDECVTCEEQNTETDKPRKVYSITKRGQKELENWLYQEPEKSKSRNEFLLKIFFGWNVPVEVCLQHINTVLQKSLKNLQYYEELYNNKSKQRKTRQHIYQQLTVRSGILLTQAIVAWCKEARNVLEGMKNDSSFK
jgi:DNA-binding PadR family transcriptional regulator